MKLQYILFPLAGFLFASCVDKSLNDNPTRSTDLDPNYQLTAVQLRTWGSMETATCYNTYISAFTQQMQGNWDASNYGAKYRKEDNQTKGLWNDLYSNQIKNLVDIAERTADNPSYRNLNAITRIFKVYIFSILTDIYGDIPYSEAGKAYISKITKPKFDKQQDIYQDFFSELEDAVSSLNEDGGTVTGDLMFGGDYIKWRRFGNSLRLRLALRLVKVDPAMAEAEAAAAIDGLGGLMQSREDNALLAQYTDLYDTSYSEFRRNALAQKWYSTDNAPSPFLCETFFNYLWYGRAERNEDWNRARDYNSPKQDPRTFVISRIYYHNDPNAEKKPFERLDLTDELIAKLASDASSSTNRRIYPTPKGRFWYDAWKTGISTSTTIKAAYGTSVAADGGSCRPQLNNVFLKMDIPGVAMTYAETCLLLAEAKFRWPTIAGVSQSVSELYEMGVREAMKFLEVYDSKACRIDDAAVDTYLNNNPLVAGTELEQINMQLWILHLTNAPEAFANWRRSGYPRLIAPDDTYTVDAKGGAMPRRLCYPLSEGLYNSANYQEVLHRLGGTDDWTKPVWWDKAN